MSPATRMHHINRPSPSKTSELLDDVGRNDYLIPLGRSPSTGRDIGNSPQFPSFTGNSSCDSQRHSRLYDIVRDLKLPGHFGLRSSTNEDKSLDNSQLDSDSLQLGVGSAPNRHIGLASSEDKRSGTIHQRIFLSNGSSVQQDTKKDELKAQACHPQSTTSSPTKTLPHAARGPLAGLDTPCMRKPLSQLDFNSRQASLEEKPGHLLKSSDRSDHLRYISSFQSPTCSDRLVSDKSPRSNWHHGLTTSGRHCHSRSTIAVHPSKSTLLFLSDSITPKRTPRLRETMDFERAPKPAQHPREADTKSLRRKQALYTKSLHVFPPIDVTQPVWDGGREASDNENPTSSVQYEPPHLRTHEADKQGSSSIDYRKVLHNQLEDNKPRKGILRKSSRSTAVGMFTAQKPQQSLLRPRTSSVRPLNIAKGFPDRSIILGTDRSRLASHREEIDEILLQIDELIREWQ